jgi:hypothetical protein
MSNTNNALWKETRTLILTRADVCSFYAHCFLMPDEEFRYRVWHAYTIRLLFQHFEPMRVKQLIKLLKTGRCRFPIA